MNYPNFTPACQLFSESESSENYMITTAIYFPTKTMLIKNLDAEELVYTYDFYKSEDYFYPPYLMESNHFGPVPNPDQDKEVTVVVNYYDSVYLGPGTPPPTPTSSKKSKIRLADAEIGGDIPGSN